MEKKNVLGDNLICKSPGLVPFVVYLAHIVPKPAIPAGASVW